MEILINPIWKTHTLKCDWKVYYLKLIVRFSVFLKEVFKEMNTFFFFLIIKNLKVRFECRMVKINLIADFL